MSLIIFGAPMKYGADIEGLDKSIDSLLKFDKSLSGKINTIEVEYYKDEIRNEKLKNLNTVSNYCEKLSKRVNKVINNNDFPLVIGGDHSISIGTVAGVSKNKNIGLFWIDAHGDFNTDETTYSGHIHGMPLSAIVGLGDKKLSNCFYRGKKVNENNIVYLGTRDFDDKEGDLIRRKNLLNFSAEEIDRSSIKSCLDKALKNMSPKLEGIHISLDLDVLDPEICPGVSVPVPKGLTFDQLREILAYLFSTGKVISMDIVEYNPKFDIDNKSAELVGKTILLVKNSFDFR